MIRTNTIISKTFENMIRKLFVIGCLCPLCACDYKTVPLQVQNESDKTIYFYTVGNRTDSIPYIPSLLHLGSCDTGETGQFGIGGTIEDPHLSSDTLTVFFISEEVLRQNTLKEIHQKQVYTKKLFLTEKELKENNWTIIYKED